MTYVDILGQCHREYQVGEVARDGSENYSEIKRKLDYNELGRAFDAARDAGLWQFER
ncbi:MAG: hypothetical protein ACE5Q6_07300 [Dehalococcoidia bacterium]